MIVKAFDVLVNPYKIRHPAYSFIKIHGYILIIKYMAIYKIYRLQVELSLITFHIRSVFPFNIVLDTLL